MLTRLRMLWERVRDSLWFIPTLFSLIAIGVSLLLVYLEEQFEWKLRDSGYWLLGGGADGARLVLSTIAGSLITVTGVVFSVTIVSLQLASSQFTPRILRNFMADRSNQIVLGVMISTFTYTLLVLRVIRSKDENGAEFVPHLAVGFAILLALTSIAFLIYFIHHSARSMQAAVILSRITDEALQNVRRLFPDDVGSPEEQLPALGLMSGTPLSIASTASGYIQAVDERSLFDFGAERKLLIRMATPVGSFVVEGQTIAKVWSQSACDDAVQQQIRNAIVIGEQRTPGQDLEFSMIEIVDIAIKALSPGINDPTTAVHCMHRLTQILLALGSRRPPAALRTKSGDVHFLAMHATFEDSVRLAFDQILFFGRENPEIVRELRRSAEQLLKLLPPQRHSALQSLLAKLRSLSAELADQNAW
ncbi:MAG: DUF2254 domain-containing protein [Planctomycetota bacterium]|nr:DUF2254 domain-containing protein [Planctomycetota bacterium]